ncbi:hypothetical protein ACFQMA_13940 [Halosimplex aquaticum]|uniref:Uncharacterized protein n=1 Tax=Halosimplex aquaticum TaxID=3026162 RepID=A0ABD5Y5E6_9EURY|nr:hypothetical protein [Halosimplex aquaticum]
MGDHTDVRLETQDGTVVAYFAPNFEVKPKISNDLHEADRSGGDPPVVRDGQRYSHDLSVQGVFEHSSNLPAAHADDVESMVGAAPVTPRDQVNRLVYYATQVGGPFHLYEGADEYTATDPADVNLRAGVYPAVQIAEITPPSQAGLPRFEYAVDFTVGVPR